MLAVLVIQYRDFGGEGTQIEGLCDIYIFFYINFFVYYDHVLKKKLVCGPIFEAKCNHFKTISVDVHYTTGQKRSL